MKRKLASDMDRIEKMKDEDIDFSDCPPVTEKQLKQAIRRCGLKPINRASRLAAAWLDATHHLAIDRIRSDADYDRVVVCMEEALEEIGQQNNHPLRGLTDILDMRLRQYDEEKHPIDDVRGVDMLRFLMEQHGLKPKDLTELGNQKVVAELLSGTRQVNRQQAKTLAKRFHVSSAVFLTDIKNAQKKGKPGKTCVFRSNKGSPRLV